MIRPDDSDMDHAHATYLRARTSGARSLAMAELLRVSDGFIRRVMRHRSTGQIREVEEEDRLQTARLAFVDAVYRCDPSRAKSLRPFAINRIRHELQTLAEKNFTIKIPRRSGVSESVMRDIEKLWSKEGREPTRAELNGHAKAYYEAQQRPRVSYSLDAPHSMMGSENDVFVDDAHSDGAPGALELLIEREQSLLGFEIGGRIEKKNRESARIVLPRKYMNTETVTESFDRSPPTPLDALRVAVQDLQKYLSGLAAKRAEIDKEEQVARAELAKLAGFAPVPAHAAPASNVAPIRLAPLAVNQDKLPHQIVKFLKGNPGSRVKAIASALGVESTAVAVELTKLRETKQVKSEGKARGTSYSLASRAA